MIDRQTLSKLAADAYEDALTGKLESLNPFDAIADAVLAALPTEAPEPVGGRVLANSEIRAWIEACNYEPAKATLRELLNRPATVSSAVPVKAPTSAWLGYWPGAGSIDSITRVTRSEHTAKQWASDGAEVTELIERPVSPQDRGAIIEECAKVADMVEVQQDVDLGDANSGGAGEAAKAIRALIGDTK